MTDLVLLDNKVPAMTDEAIEKVRQLEAYVAQMPQHEFETTHNLHAGMYGRTIKVPKQYIAVGVLIKVPTLVIVSGHGAFFVGDKAVEVKGYQIFEAEAYRKGAFVAIEESYVTMLFATNAKTVEEAEEEFTDEANALQTRKNVLKQGEQVCLVQQ